MRERLGRPNGLEREMEAASKEFLGYRGGIPITALAFL